MVWKARNTSGTASTAHPSFSLLIRESAALANSSHASEKKIPSNSPNSRSTTGALGRTGPWGT